MDIGTKRVNRPIMVHTQTLVHSGGPRRRILALFYGRTHQSLVSSVAQAISQKPKLIE